VQQPARTAEETRQQLADAGLPDLPPTNAKLSGMALLAALVVLVISMGLDLLLLDVHQSPRTLVELSDLFAATLIGSLFFVYGRIRQRQLRRRMEMIAEMNHHVRNALQVISSSSYMGDREKELAALQEAVKRVDWALREILPKL
jgi:two-component sensor histidine kinase